MINKEDLLNVINVIESHLIGYAIDETDGYKHGSYFTPVKYRSGTSYLELYYFVFNQVYSILDLELNYEDFGFTDSGIVDIINKANELIFYYD